MVNVDESFELRYKKGGNEFQVLVDFNKLKEFRTKPQEVSVYDVLADPKIFKDQKKGELASGNEIEKQFDGKSEEEVLKEILLEGECQIPTAYLNQLREEKKIQIVNYIATNAINTQTKTRYTTTMIESEFDQITYNVNPDQDHVRQAEEVIKFLKKRIPIVIEKSIVEISVQPQYVGPFYGPFRKFGKITKEFYDEAGNLHMHIEVTSGIVEDVIEFVKKHANNEASYHVSSR